MNKLLVTSWALALVLTGAPEALAQMDGEDQFNAAVDKFGASKHEEAIRLLDAAEKEATDSLLLARIHRQKGLALEALGRRVEAVVSFLRALSYRSDIQVSGQEHAAPVVELFECARRIRARGIPEHEVPKAYGEEIQRQECPVSEGGAVSAKERALGLEHREKARALGEKGELDEAIAEMVLAIGFDRAREYLRAIAELYEKKGDFPNAMRYLREYATLAPSEEKDALAKRIEDLELREKQRLSTGITVLEVNVTGAMVKVDGAELGKTPLPPVTLPVGRHQLEITAEGYLPYQQSFDVESAKQRTIRLELLARPKTGHLLLSVSETGARVRVDGKELGVAPLQQELELVVGTHEVVVEKLPEFLPYTKSVEIQEGQRANLLVQLQLVPEIEPPSAWGWVLMASGGALAGGGVVFTFLAKQERDRLGEASVNSDGAIVGFTQVEALEAEDRGDLHANVALGMFVGAGTALVSGLLITLLTGGEPEMPGVAIEASAAGGSATLSLDF